MRLLLFLTFTVMTNLIFAQGDYQWMIFNNSYKNGTNYTTAISGGISSPIYIDSVKMPNMTAEPNASNDFFAIFNSGNYYLSDRTNHADVSSGTDFTVYEVIFAETTNYLYMTNRYEDDDPKDRVKVNPTNTNGTTPETVNVGDYNDPHDKFTHQTPVPGSDIVFIVDKNYFNEGCTDYKLCYQDQINQVSFSPITFNVNDTTSSANNAVYKSGASFATASLSFNNKCIEIPNTNGENLFIKFRVNGSTSLDSEAIAYTLSSIPKRKDGNCESIPSQDSILNGYHDPNFVELKCVWEENGDYYGIYHIECYNDGFGGFANLKMTTPIPSFIDQDSIEILNWMANCNYGCDTLCSEDLQIIGSTPDSLKVQFPTGLDGYTYTTDSNKICKYTAFFEFKAKINIPTGESIHTYNLSLGMPNTNFNTSLYHITTFIEQKSCLPEELALSILKERKEDSSQNLENYDGCMLGRTFNNCYKPCGKQVCKTTPPFPWIYYLGAFLLLGLLVFIYNKLKP